VGEVRNSPHVRESRPRLHHVGKLQGAVYLYTIDGKINKSILNNSALLFGELKFHKKNSQYHCS
jgi:hypothetical protein